MNRRNKIRMVIVTLLTIAIFVLCVRVFPYYLEWLYYSDLPVWVKFLLR